MKAAVVVLNGGSSSGKSSIARRLQDLLGPTWLTVGVEAGSFAFRNLGSPTRLTEVDVRVTSPGTGAWELSSVRLYPKASDAPTPGNAATILTVILRSAPQTATETPPVS